MTVRTLAVVALAALLGGAAYHMAAPGGPPWLSRSRAGFEVRDAEWRRTERPQIGALGTQVSYDGTARIVGTGEFAYRHALVFVDLIRSRRVNPSFLPDTQTLLAAPLDGGPVVNGQDWAFGCTHADSEYHDLSWSCVSSFEALEARFQVIGWIELAVPPSRGR